MKTIPIPSIDGEVFKLLCLFYCINITIYLVNKQEYYRIYNLFLKKLLYKKYFLFLNSVNEIDNIIVFLLNGLNYDQYRILSIVLEPFRHINWEVFFKLIFILTLFPSRDYIICINYF